MFQEFRQTDKSSSSASGFWWGFLFSFGLVWFVFGGRGGWMEGEARPQRMEPIMELKADQNLEEKVPRHSPLLSYHKRSKSREVRIYLKRIFRFLHRECATSWSISFSWFCEFLGSRKAPTLILMFICSLEAGSNSSRHFYLISPFLKQYSLQTENK